MTTTLEAIYERGVLRPSHSIPLAEGTRVQITLTTSDVLPKATQTSGRFSWKKMELAQDGYSGSVADELIRQRREE